MTRQHKTSATSAGPHAGQDSIRQAYDAMGPQAFYSMHGERYTNPHVGRAVGCGVQGDAPKPGPGPDARHHAALYHPIASYLFLAA